MPERRYHPRTNVYKGAKIALAGRAALNCVVRNLSEQGACLHHFGNTDVPAEFSLTFDTGRKIPKCRVAWQNFNQVGVFFE
jgi:hypothetical protein